MKYQLMSKHTFIIAVIQWKMRPANPTHAVIHSQVPHGFHIGCGSAALRKVFPECVLMVLRINSWTEGGITELSRPRFSIKKIGFELLMFYYV